MRKKIFTLLACAAMFSFAHAAPATCNLTLTPPTIDGDASDWGSTWLQMTQGPTSNTTSGLTAKFQMEYDVNNLYIIITATDQTVGDTAPANSYERDCMEVMLSLDTLTSGGITGMYQFRRVYGWNGTTAKPGGDFGLTDVSNYGSGANTVADWNTNPKFNLKETIDGSTYTQEWQLPWDSLSARMDTLTTKNPGSHGAWDKKQFKLELQVADNTTNAASGRTQQEFWFGNSNNAWNNSAYQQVVKLQYPLAVNTPSNLKNITASVLNRNTIKLSKVVKSAKVYLVNGQLIKTVNNTDVISGLKPDNLYLIKTDNNTNIKMLLIQ
jgi:Carbohydrate family 9 binding domain-like